MVTEVRLMTVSELAIYLGVSKSWIYIQVERNLIPHVRLGTSIRFMKSEIDRWLASLQQEAANG